MTERPDDTPPSGGNRGLPVKRQTPDVAAGVARMIRAIGVRVAGEDLDALEILQQLDQAQAQAWSTAIAGLRRNYSDPQIGAVLGITRQAVEKRWPRQPASDVRGSQTPEPEEGQ